jgi:hypothetical protein
MNSLNVFSLLEVQYRIDDLRITNYYYSVFANLGVADAAGSSKGAQLYVRQAFILLLAPVNRLLTLYRWNVPRLRSQEVQGLRSRPLTLSPASTRWVCFHKIWQTLEWRATCKAPANAVILQANDPGLLINIYSNFGEYVIPGKYASGMETNRVSNDF